MSTHEAAAAAERSQPASTARLAPTASMKWPPSGASSRETTPPRLTPRPTVVGFIPWCRVKKRTASGITVPLPRASSSSAAANRGPPSRPLHSASRDVVTRPSPALMLSSLVADVWPMVELERQDDGGRGTPWRIRPRFLIALVLVLAAAGAAVGIRTLVHAHSRSVRAAQLSRTANAFAAANRDLSARSLPRGVLPGPGTAVGCSGAALCGHSALTPQQLAPELRAFVGPALRVRGRVAPLLGSCLHPPGARHPFCAATEAGRFRGYPILAIAFWNVVVVKHGPGPPGARLYDRTRSERLYLRGSTVSISLSAPALLSDD